MTVKSVLLALCLGLTSLAAASNPKAPRLPIELIKTAVETDAPRWKFINGTRIRQLPETFALQVTALAAHDAPDLEVDGKTLATHLAEKLRYFLVTPEAYEDGTTREPEAQGGIGGWSHNVPANALLLAKRTPEVWNQLSADEHHRADVLMHALALAAHFCLDDDNDFYILLDGYSLFHKSWNPNHVEGYVGVIIAASLYFGPDELNAFFRSFEFDPFVAELQELNFQNIRACWTANPVIRDLMMNGGEIAVPADQILAQGTITRGAGVRNDFTLNGVSLHEPWVLHREQAIRLFIKAVRGEVNIHGDQHGQLLHRASQATRSPWEGQTGMIFELETNDWTGMRTSLHYAFDAVMIDLNNAATLKAVGVWDPRAGGDVLDRRMGVGMGDFLFRSREGYAGWGNGKPMINDWDETFAPMGGDFIIGIWRAYFPPPPAPTPPPPAAEPAA